MLADKGEASYWTVGKCYHTLPGWCTWLHITLLMKPPSGWPMWPWALPHIFDTNEGAQIIKDLDLMGEEKKRPGLHWRRKVHFKHELACVSPRMETEAIVVLIYLMIKLKPRLPAGKRPPQHMKPQIYPSLAVLSRSPWRTHPLDI